MKIFYEQVDRRSRKEMTTFLENHFRYNTMNGWNRSTSYANCVKIGRLGLPSEIADKLYELLDVDGSYDMINDRLREFAEEHDYQWQVGFNGRSSGYLVLYRGGKKLSDHKSYCTSCWQKNFKYVITDENRAQAEKSPSDYTETCQCGRCGKPTRVNYATPRFEYFTNPGQSVDSSEDFSEWSMDELKQRVKLVQEFDRLCDDVVAEAICLAKSCDIEDEEYTEVKTRKVLRCKEA